MQDLEFVDSVTGRSNGYLIAGAVISMIPCIVLHVFLQRFYVQGLASGAVKG